MEQIIITEKPIIIISPTTTATHLMKKKRMMTNKEELNILIEQQEQHELQQQHTIEEEREEVEEEIQRCNETRERMIEKRVKLNVRENISSKSLRKSLNTVVKKKMNNNKRRRGEMSEQSSNDDSHNVLEQSALEMNGSNICCFSLLSSCASLQETNNSSALSQISTSFSNLDDEPLLLSSSPSNTTSTTNAADAKCYNDEEEECMNMSSHFLSSKALSDIDEDEINEDDELKNNNNTNNHVNNNSSSNCPIPNLTISSQEDLSSCPLQAGHELSQASTICPTSSSTIVDTLEIESNKSQVKVTIVNSATFMNREHTKKWSQDETLKFYKGLELFGTDFSMISRLFTNRTRKMCKNKFRKEEKVNMNEIERRLVCNRTLRMKKVVQRLNVIRAKLNLKFAATPEQRIQIITNARRSRLDSFNSIDSLDINVVETIESQLNGQPLF